jgi:hypothetical protein
LQVVSLSEVAIIVVEVGSLDGMGIVHQVGGVNIARWVGIVHRVGGVSIVHWVGSVGVVH